MDILCVLGHAAMGGKEFCSICWEYVSTTVFTVVYEFHCSIYLQLAFSCVYIVLMDR